MDPDVRRLQKFFDISCTPFSERQCAVFAERRWAVFAKLAAAG